MTPGCRRRGRTSSVAFFQFQPRLRTGRWPGGHPSEPTPPSTEDSGDPGEQHGHWIRRIGSAQEQLDTVRRVSIPGTGPAHTA